MSLTACSLTGLILTEVSDSLTGQNFDRSLTASNNVNLLLTDLLWHNNSLFRFIFLVLYQNTLEHAIIMGICVLAEHKSCRISLFLVEISLTETVKSSLLLQS
jgi:hypothetical protein